MRVRSSLLLAISVSAMLAGCGGFNTPLPNIYAGDWGGAYTDVARPATGAVDWLISSNGTMTGSITRDSDGEVGTFTGTIESSGQFTGSCDFAGSLDFTNIHGAITTSSTTTGNFAYTFNGSTTSASFTLTPN